MYRVGIHSASENILEVLQRRQSTASADQRLYGAERLREEKGKLGAKMRRSRVTTRGGMRSSLHRTNASARERQWETPTEGGQAHRKRPGDGDFARGLVRDSVKGAGRKIERL